MKVKELVQRTVELYEELARVPEKHQEIRNEIVELNIKLVPHILQKYKPYTEDMYQEGCIGLIKAADSYSIEKQVPFVNYACLCIEREIQLAHKYSSRRIEYKAKNKISSFDAPCTLDNGDEVSLYDTIEDCNSSSAFDTLVVEMDIKELYEECILPCIDEYAQRGRNKSTIDIEQWTILEIKYIMELAAEDSQRRRLTFTAIAEELGTTTQNIRTRHQRVMEMIRVRYLELQK